MLTALTHRPSPNLESCELTYIRPEEIDPANAAHQHRLYCEALTELGATVQTLNQNIHLPDSVFVEDAAIVLDEIAVITSMGVRSRRPERDLIETELAKYRPIARIELPATIEGGDILQIGRRVFVGNSSRTNELGIEALTKIIQPLGYDVVSVDVSGCLHLTTACCALGEETLLINPGWIDARMFGEFKQITVPREEPFAANILRFGKTICIHSGFTKTADLLRGLGIEIRTIDISEFLKAEAGLTCMSVIFKT